MGYYVYTLVSFATPREMDLADFASQWLAQHDTMDLCPGPHHMLDYMATGHGVGYGHKGEVFSWGEVGNGTMIESLTDGLHAFWLALGEAGVTQAMIFLEAEQSGAARQYVIP